MADALSDLVKTYHPQLAKLRAQLEGLVPERAATIAKEAVANPATLLDRIKDNAPLIMEVGSSLLGRMRQSSGQVTDQVTGRVAEAAVAMRRREPWFRGVGVAAPVLLVTVAVGAAYALGRSHGRTRPGRTDRQGRRSRAGVA